MRERNRLERSISAYRAVENELNDSVGLIEMAEALQAMMDEDDRIKSQDDLAKVIGKVSRVLDGPYQGEVAKKLATRFKVALPAVAAVVAGSDAGRAAPPPKGAPNLCLDHQQLGYSRGAKADVLGLKLQCGPGGVWVPVAGADPQRKGA